MLVMGMMPDLARIDALRAIPREITPASIAATRALYSRLHGEFDVAGVRADRDLSYGPHARHRLDVFRSAEGRSDLRPVFVFMHGGGFVAGDKKTDDAIFYENIGVWAARHGLVGVNMTYRLAPDHAWPSAKEDLARVVEWLQAHGAEHGGDPERIILMGHSAGATHVATYLADAACRPSNGAQIRAAVLVSGSYDIGGPQISEGQVAYFGDREELYPSRSPLEGLAKSPLPLLVGVAERDPPAFHDHALRLTAARQAQSQPTRLLYLRGHNHFSPMLHFNLRDEGELERMIPSLVAG